MMLVVKNLPADAGDVRDADLIPGSGRCPGEGHGNVLQYSLPGEAHEQKSLVGYSPWCRKVRHGYCLLPFQVSLSRGL